MNKITINKLPFKPFVSSEKIEKINKFLADVIASEMGPDEVPIFVGILNGSFMFVADFIRLYPHDCHVTFVKLASYEGTGTTGKVKKLIGMNEDLTNKTVIILEDIIDSGTTLEEIYRIFEKENLKALKIASLFFKPEAYKKELPIDYVGMEIEDKFILGYGLDFDGLGRNLKDVYQLDKD